MKLRTKLLIASGVLVAITGAGASASIASRAIDSEAPIQGAALQKASAAALKATGGGRVTGTEVDDEESYYEVEVTLPGGRQVDVQLDQNFKVVGRESDSESGDDK